MTELEEIAIEYEKLNPEKARAAQTQLAELTQILSQSLAKNADQELTIARLTADAKLNDMAWNDNQSALKKQAEEIIALKKACIVYHNQIINMKKEEEE